MLPDGSIVVNDELTRLRTDLAAARAEASLAADCESLRADKDRLEEARGCLEACSGLLRLVGTTWTDESNAHKIAHKEADKADRIVAAIDAARADAARKEQA